MAGQRAEFGSSVETTLVLGVGVELRIPNVTTSDFEFIQFSQERHGSQMSEPSNSGISTVHQDFHAIGHQSLHFRMHKLS